MHFDARTDAWLLTEAKRRGVSTSAIIRAGVAVLREVVEAGEDCTRFGLLPRELGMSEAELVDRVNAEAAIASEPLRPRKRQRPVRS